MTDNIFRSVDFWKSAVMTMPDSSFFELMRSVFGKIKTPFNKQRLINDLETFLLRDDIRKTIAAYIGKNDAKIITAAAFFNEPSPFDLGVFFEEEFNFAQLQEIIVNLEERFILYRLEGDKDKTYPEKNDGRLALNPVLEQILLPFLKDISILFPQTPQKSENSLKNSCRKRADKVIVNDRILAGFFSFAAQNNQFFKSEGVIRKKILDMGNIHLPGIDLPLLTGSLQVLGLFYADSENLTPDKKLFDDFAKLTAAERSVYCAAALLVYSELDSPGEILSPLFKTKIAYLANFIQHLLSVLDESYLFPKQFLRKLTEILKQKTLFSFNTVKLFEAMEKTGLLITESNQYKKAVFPQKKAEIAKENPLIAIDSGSSVLVFPEIELTDALFLASFTDIKEARVLNGDSDTFKFEINRDSFVRALDNNLNADEIIFFLKRLSADRIDNTLIWNLKEWEKRYSEVSLKEGVVLALSQDRQYLAETAPLAELIRETLAPGVYLLPANSAEKASNVLQNAGIDIVAKRKEKSVSVNRTNAFRPPSVQEKLPQISMKDFLNPPDSTLYENTSPLIENFHEALKNLAIDDAGRAELSARIDRKLILCESQLREADIRYEKLEARLMDYAGKQNIAKQAVAQKSYVEIIFRNAGKEKTLTGIPESLETSNGELVLVMKDEDSLNQNMKIPLAKINMIRRIKKSIFET